MIKGSWKQNIRGVMSFYTNHKVTKQIQFLGSVMLVFRYV